MEQGQQSLALCSVAPGIKMNDGNVGSGTSVAAVELAAPFRDCSELLQGKCWSCVSVSSCFQSHA